MALRRPARLPSPDHVERTVVRGPNPATAFEVGAIDAAYGMGMRGAAGGAIRIGEKNSRKDSGELGPHQFFRGAAPLARHPADRRGFNQALPNTHGPVTQPNAVLDLLGRIPPASAATVPPT